MNRKAIVLLSGGLDSILAVKLMLEQGVEVETVNFHIAFAVNSFKNPESSAAKAAKSLGVPFETIDITGEYLEIFKNPRYGYGANVNPCIDCKIFMLKKAKEYMEAHGASFLVTGEVLGERPMSQRKDALDLIEKRAGVKGILLRPLSAKLLEPTIPETEGVVDRDKLFDISGRSRKPQMALAEKFGIKEYPNPAGGCLLTDPGFAKRVKDLIAHGSLDIDNLKLLNAGRHFRLSKTAKLAIGRSKEDNDALESQVKPDDICFKLKGHEGPFSILRGDGADSLIELAASIIAHHTKYRSEELLSVNYWKPASKEPSTISVKPASPATVDNLRI